MSIISSMVITCTILLPIIFKPIDTNQHAGAYWWSKIVPKYTVAGQWVKLDVPWDNIESSEGVYNWPTILDENVKFLNNNGNPILFNFHNSPTWARDTLKPCTLPNQDSIDNYIAFIHAAIVRYKPNAIEIWNEPESDSSIESGWCCGCVPNPADYTTVLNQVYAGIKPIHSNITIIGGALMQYDTEWARDWFKTNPQMDAVSFHYYTYYDPNIPSPFVGGLVRRIAEVQAQTNKPVWLTETALLCTLGSACTEDFRSQQATWIQLVYPLDGAEKVFWFSQNEVWWNKCNMLNERTNTVFPVYNEFYTLVSGERINSAERETIERVDTEKSAPRQIERK